MAQFLERLNSRSKDPGFKPQAAQVAEELKTVIHATPPMEERRKKEIHSLD